MAGPSSLAPSATHLEFSVQPGGAQVNQPLNPQPVMRALDASDDLVSSFTGQVTLTLENSPQGAGLNGTTTVTAVNGVATFSGLSISAASSSYRLHALSGSLTPVVSATFAITAPPPTGATYLLMPASIGNAVAGQPFPSRPCVFAMKENDQIDSQYTATLSLAVGTNSSQGTLSGTTSQPASGGSACFPGLLIDRPGTGYTLVGTSGTLPSVTSNAFNVIALPVTVRANVDFNGDGRTDPAIRRLGVGPNGQALWWAPGAGFTVPFPDVAGDVPVPADYDGDGRTDIAFYRPTTGVWFGQRSSNGQLAPWTILGGQPGDVPVVGDYDSDQRCDIAIFRPADGLWFGLKAANGQVVLNSTTTMGRFGQSGDIAVTADYDADGKTDVAVYMPSTGQIIALSSAGGANVVRSFGAVTGDAPVAKRPNLPGYPY